MSHHHGTRSGEFATPQHTDTASAPLPVPSGALLEALGTTITPDLLVEALTHRSFAHEHPGTANYERLEFPGMRCSNWSSPKPCSRRTRI